jgi:hypothetical protein
MDSILAPYTPLFLHVSFDNFIYVGTWSHIIPSGLKCIKCAEPSK